MGWFGKKKAPEYETPCEQWAKLVARGVRPGDASAQTNYYPCLGGQTNPAEITAWGVAATCTPHRGENLTGYSGREWENAADERAEQLAMGERTRESMDVPLAWAAPEPKSWAAPTPARWEAPVEQPYHAPERIQVHAPAEIPVPVNAVSSRTFDVPLSGPVTIPMMDVGHGYKVPVFGGGHQAQPAPVEEAPIPVETGSWLGALFGIGGRR